MSGYGSRLHNVYLNDRLHVRVGDFGDSKTMAEAMVLPLLVISLFMALE